MFKSKIYIIFIVVLAISCSGGGDDFIDVPQDVIPTNLTLTINIVGADATNPNGNGTGIVEVSALAVNAIKYGFKIGSDQEQESISGDIEHTFTESGTNNYVITAFAYSSTGNSISTFKNVSIFVDNGQFQLVWADEFNTNGAPDNSKWSYEIGTGCPDLCGWGNGESEYYTDRTDNVIVEDGSLKITAKKESYLGSEYTSTRMKTQGKFDFTYGKIEVKAKLPEGEGTWPAIWMLGSNITTVGWPACGEIDIMEHWGHIPTEVSSATHKPSCSGGCNDTRVGSTIVNDFSTEFHIYALDWSADELRFYIDETFLYSYKPAVKNSNTWPFDKDQFIILNIAMGASWFTIDPNFSESSMEVDYIRVYQ